MGNELRFDGKVVIVTGAGNGLGRAHALAFASRGAKVVVNDLGGGMHGQGQSQKAADVVVGEIEEAGGEATANYDSVEDGDKIVQTAMDSYGRIDVVINNAGILRDVSFHKMSLDDWDLIYRVHVYGSFRVTHAAWPHMRKQGYGRVVMTASAAGIYGNFGQANYSMAKLGLTGLGNTLAIEGGRKGIHVNTIAPIAGSRLTETVLPEDLIKALKPEYVSPLVLWLCHEDCKESGGLFEVGGGYFGKLRWERAKGDLVRLGRAISVESVKKSFGKITSFEESTHPPDINQSMGPIMENIQAGPSKGGNELVDVDLALGYEYPDFSSSYDERDLALYALGVGAAADPLDQQDLKLVYEMHGDGFTALPTFGVIPAMTGLIEMARQGKNAPGLNYGLDRLLHGEQYTEVIRPLPRKAKLTHKARIKEIWDKGKGAIINTETKSYDENGDLLLVNNYIYFIRGAGDFGGDRGPSAKLNEAPERKPDKVVEEKVAQNQALLYRLSGDVNPLHVDPNFAKAFGFEKPILHGLCSYGYAGRHVVRAFAKNGDPRFFKSIKVRFAKSVFPGETLVTEMWQDKDNRIVFRCKVKERDEVVISNAVVELYEQIPKAKAKKKPVSATAKSASTQLTPISADVFSAIGVYLGQTAGITDKIGKVFQFQLGSPDSTWTVDVKNGAGSVGEGETAKPDCTLELTDSNFMLMCTGKADAQKLYFSGDLKISGDVMASQKLKFLGKLDPQLVVSAMNARGGSGESAPAAAPAKAASGDVFLGIKAYVSEHPELAEKIQKVFQFKLTGPDSLWTMDLRKGAVDAGETAPPDVTLELADSDFMDMTSGKADPQKMYFDGRLKVSGDVMASQKLSFLQKIDPEWAKKKVAELKAQGAGGAAGNAQPAAPKKASGKAAKAPALIAALETRIAGNAGLVGEVKAIIALRIADPDGGWTIDLSSGKGSVSQGLTDEPTTTLTISDVDFSALCAGDGLAQKFFQNGKLRVDGDMNVAKRLGFLNKLA